MRVSRCLLESLMILIILSVFLVPREADSDLVSVLMMTMFGNLISFKDLVRSLKVSQLSTPSPHILRSSFNQLLSENKVLD